MTCSNCDDYAREDCKHIIFQCHGTEQLRISMQEALTDKVGRVTYDEIVNRNDYPAIMMGKIPDDIPEITMMGFWTVVCIYVSKIYWATLKNRIGIG